MAKYLSKIAPFASRLLKDERGTQLVETAVWIGLITALVVLTIQTMGGHVATIMESVTTSLGTAAGAL